MATTTNFGWETPDDTDLVKDGAAAIRTLGQSIDTSMADLEGGTTGQVLAKNSNTDMDFIWTNGGDITEVTAGTGISGGGTSGAVTITNSMATAIDAKGDLVAGTGADAFSRLGVGANNTVLTADSAQATGLKWASVAATKNFTLLGTTATTSGTTVTLTGISGQDQIMVLLKGISTNTATAEIRVQINTDTAGNYDNAYGSISNPPSYSISVIQASSPTQSSVTIGTMGTSTATGVSGYFMLYGCNTAGKKPYHYSGAGTADTGGNQTAYLGGGVWNNTGTVTSISINSNGTFDGGSFLVYGSA